MNIQISDQTANRVVTRLAAQGVTIQDKAALMRKVLDALASSAPGATIEDVISKVNQGASGESSESALELANRLGLVGAFESGRSDLATNPEHMNGFGQ